MSVILCKMLPAGLGEELSRPTPAALPAANRGDRLRSCDLHVPNVALYQTELHPENLVVSRFFPNEAHRPMMLHEYEGIEPPNEIADPIGYRLWLEANKCDECNGRGEVEVELDMDGDGLPPPMDVECPECDGTGLSSQAIEMLDTLNAD